MIRPGGHFPLPVLIGSPGGGKIILSAAEACREEMDMDEVTYICSVCKKETSVKKGQPIPLCCGKEMGPLPFCTSVPNPEMSRNSDADEPCDPGTLPRKRK
jgi:hypothetical protein